MLGVDPLKWLPPGWGPPPTLDLFGTPGPAATRAAASAMHFDALPQAGRSGAHSGAAQKPQPGLSAWQQQPPQPGLPVPDISTRNGGHLRQQTQALDRFHQQQEQQRQQEQQEQQQRQEQQPLWQQSQQPPLLTRMLCSPLLVPDDAGQEDDELLSDCLPDLQSLLEPAAISSSLRASSQSPADTALLGRAGSLGCAVSDATWDAGDSPRRPQPRVCMHATRSGVLLVALSIGMKASQPTVPLHGTVGITVWSSTTAQLYCW